MVKKKIKKEATKMGKGNKANCEARISVIINLLLGGMLTSDIFSFVAENEDTLKWGATERQIVNYIKEATCFIVNNEEEKRGARIAWRKLQLRYLYKRSLDAGKLSVALEALKEMSKLSGDYPNL